MTHPYFLGSPLPRVLAHRGLVTAELADTGTAENSFAAVAAAHAAGVTYIESDCHLTADGTVVLFHDSTLTRVTGDPRPLAEVDATELDRLMASRGGLITLQQALEAFPDTRFNIDVKADAAAESAGRIIAPHADRVLLTSFDDARRMRALDAARAAGGMPATSGGSHVITQLVLATRLGARRRAARVLAGVDALQIPERQSVLRVLTPRLVDAAHEAGVEVHVWTVNEPADMVRLVREAGVDGIVTDRADVALEVLSPGASDPGLDVA